VANEWDVADVDDWHAIICLSSIVWDFRRNCIALALKAKAPLILDVSDISFYATS